MLGHGHLLALSDRTQDARSSLPGAQRPTICPQLWKEWTGKWAGEVVVVWVMDTVKPTQRLGTSIPTEGVIRFTPQSTRGH